MALDGQVAVPAHGQSLVALPWPTPHKRLFPAADLRSRLAYGDLPVVVTAATDKDRADLLRACATVHLEQEIRREAMVKDWEAFVRFLRLAASESGGICNYAAVSRECGLSQPTGKEHYQFLEDMFVGFRVPAYTRSPRKNLLTTAKFLLFDLGVRHGAAGLRPSTDIVDADPGRVFEQWVGIELWKRLGYSGEGSLYYLRTRDGAEIDFIVEQGSALTPIEVKWTERPDMTDARHLLSFLDENPTRAKHAYIVCRCPWPMRLDDRVTALHGFVCRVTARPTALGERINARSDGASG